MFERFTQDARQVVVGAQEQARVMKHHHVGTQHVLLALLEEPESRAGRALLGAGVTGAQVREEILRRMSTTTGPLDIDDAEALKAIGIDLDAVRGKVEQTFGPGALDGSPDDDEQTGRGLIGRLRGSRRGPKPSGHVPFTPRSKKVLELSLREAIRLKHTYIGTEHILLGMVREGEGLAVQILVDTGVDLDALRRAVLDDLGKAA